MSSNSFIVVIDEILSPLNEMKSACNRNMLDSDKKKENKNK